MEVKRTGAQANVCYHACTYRHTDRQTDRQTYTHTDRHTHRWIPNHTDTYKHIYRPTYLRTYIHVISTHLTTSTCLTQGGGHTGSKQNVLPSANLSFETKSQHSTVIKQVLIATLTCISVQTSNSFLPFAEKFLASVAARNSVQRVVRKLGSFIR